MTREEIVYRDSEGRAFRVGGYRNDGGYQLYDSRGDEVVPPTCERCLGLKTPLMGRGAFDWICLGCRRTVVGDS